MIKMFVDGSAGEIVVDRDRAIRLWILGNRIDLLMYADRESHVPIILPAQLIQRFLFVRFAALFFCDQLFQGLSLSGGI